MSSPRALVVDNNEYLAQTVAEILADRGFAVEVAVTGTQALALWRQQEAELVVVDVDLPDIGGLTLARRLARRGPGCRLVVMSAGDPRRVMAVCDELGAAFLAKPFGPSQLVAAVRRATPEPTRRQLAAAAEARRPRRLLGSRTPRGFLQQARDPREN